MAVAPIAIADGIANVTLALPILQDSLTYAGNWLVSNTIGAIMIAMVLVAFGFAIIVRLVKGRRGRK